MAMTEEQLRILQEANKALAEEAELKKDSIELLKLQREAHAKGTTQYEFFTEEISNQTRALQDLKTEQRERTEEIRTETAELKKLTKAEKDLADQRERERKKREADAKKREEEREASEEGLSQQLESTLKLGRATGGFSDKAIQLGKEFKNLGGKGGNLRKVLTNLLQKLAINPIEKFVDQTIELAKAQDAAISAFRRATGASAEYNTEITQIERRNFAAGVSAEEAGAAFQTLFSEFSAFTQMAPGARAALADTTALLGELGVSAGTTAAILDKTTRATGMSAEQSRDLLLDLAGTAQDLGVPLNKLAQDFEGSFSELAKYGTQAIEVFKGLEVQAKNSGLAVNQLINIASKFDQFDSAGQAVGRLNAILGGPYLNSIDMLNATEEERIEILRRSTDAAGVQFDALNRFEQQAIAAAMGTSVEEAQRLFNMSEEQYTLDAMRQQELQELAQETQQIGEQLKSAFMALAVDLRPVIEVFASIVKGISKAANAIGSLMNGFNQFVKVGLLAAGMAAVFMAPFTGGASLLAYSAIAGSAAAGLAALGGPLAGVDTMSSGEVTPGFQQGGTVTTRQAVVHPGEILLTGGQGSEVISKEDFKSLVDTLKEFTSGGGGPQQIAVYVGQEKIDDIVIKSLDSTAGRNTFSPFTNG